MDDTEIITAIQDQINKNIKTLVYGSPVRVGSPEQIRSDLKKLSYDMLAKLNKPDQRDKDLAQLSEIMGWEEDIVLPPHQIVLDESKTFYDIKTRTIHFEFKIELL